MIENGPPSRLIGYTRVSTYGQTFDAHLALLKAAGCTRIYREKVSGARADRKELLKMLKQLAAGDVVRRQRASNLGRANLRRVSTGIQTEMPATLDAGPISVT